MSTQPPVTTAGSLSIGGCTHFARFDCPNIPKCVYANELRPCRKSISLWAKVCKRKTLFCHNTSPARCIRRTYTEFGNITLMDIVLVLLMRASIRSALAAHISGIPANLLHKTQYPTSQRQWSACRI